MNRVILVGLSGMFVVGCLKTRADLRREGVDVNRQAVVAQRDQRTPPPRPPVPTYAEEIDEQMRQLSGRVDVVENQLAQFNAAHASEKESQMRQRQEIEQRFLAYEEALKKLEAQVLALNEELAKAKADNNKAAGKGKAAKSPMEEGDQLFNQKKWKDAILAYEKYRNKNPKGKKYAEATYKMGICFQELGMKDEAKVFFDEVVTKFPKSKESKKAALRLKSIK